MRVLVAGSRDYSSEEIEDKVKYHVDMLLMDDIPGEPRPYLSFLTGGERGVTRIAEEYLVELGYDVIRIKPDSLVARHRSFDERDFFTRNSQLVDNCDCAILFWDGASRDVADLIRRLERKGVQYEIIDLL